MDSLLQDLGYATRTCCTSPGSAQEKPQGDPYRSPGGTTLRLMLDESNVGKDLSLGGITFPANSDSGEQAHGAVEVFYIVSGELEHVVNGRSEILKPGNERVRTAARPCPP
jgi:quercetin dioxygenase-like cupin family protein